MTSYLSAHFDGIGGQIKEVPEDFQVEEIPLYLPCGSGEHLYIEVEKRGMTTLDLMHRLARALNLKERDMGYAGLKDARALTRQTLSLPGVRPEQLEGLELPGTRIISAQYHRNKLRPGHLAGNRFRIRIRQVGEQALDRARNIVHVLEQVGVPNLFGSQRYGLLNNSHLIGRAVLEGNFSEALLQIMGDPALIRDPRWRQAAEAYRAGELTEARAALPPAMRDERRLLDMLLQGRDERAAVLAFPRRKLRLFLSACQSWLFDRIVVMRMESLETLWPGDLAYIHGKGACFLVEDSDKEQPRADRFEVSPSGPLFGYKSTLAQGQAGVIEQALLDHEGISLESFRLSKGLSMEGERRPLRVPLTETEVDAEGEDLIISFVLPRGSYATSVLREIMKPAQADLQNGV
jgi:tRNA pseudouridine13 synthase